MKKLQLLILTMAFPISIQSKASDRLNSQKNFDKFSFAIGVGLDYGGLGGNFLFCPKKNIGIFAGEGFNLVGFGLNAGLKLRLMAEKPDSKLSPCILGMYGYNTAILVSNGTQYDKLFYGPTLGIGLDYRFRQEKIGYWSFAILLPIRSSEVKNYIDELKNDDQINFNNRLCPIGLSIGYRFIID